MTLILVPPGRDSLLTMTDHGSADRVRTHSRAQRGIAAGAIFSTNRSRRAPCQ
jgi:hypothetical protein